MINKKKTYDFNEEIIINKDIVTRRVSTVTQSLINRFVIGNRSETRNIRQKSTHIVGLCGLQDKSIKYGKNGN